MLPSIDIPISLPFDLPLLMHPPLVHFAIALPIVILILEVVNSFLNKRTISIISFSMIVVLSVVLLGAYFTGKTDGSEAFALLGSEAKETLKEHRLLGVYLFYGSLILIVLKLTKITRLNFFKGLYIFILVAFIGATMHQGKEGGELVYKYGVNVSAAVEAQDEVDELKDENEELSSELSEVKNSLKETKALLEQMRETKNIESSDNNQAVD
jgi:uncharacterized membrane protein